MPSFSLCALVLSSSISGDVRFAASSRSTNVRRSDRSGDRNGLGGWTKGWTTARRPIRWRCGSGIGSESDILG